MEPLNENDLHDLLRRWEAPPAPPALERRIFGEQPWYRWLLRGSIRIPVPAVALLLLMLWSAWTFLSPASPPVPRELSFSDFQPVKELKPRVVSE